jgi:hypothetical protein
LDQEPKKILESFRSQVHNAKTLSGIASFSGVIAIPFTFAGILIGNQALAAASLCWLVSHFVGYITRMLQEEHRQAVARLELAEATFSARRPTHEGPLPNRVSLN